MANKATLGGAIVVAIIIISAIIVFTSYSGTSSTKTLQSGSLSAPILLIDPAQVPAGTSALVVTYTSLMVHSSDGKGSGWVNAAGSGTVNLLAVVNTSKVIGFANISVNSSINLVRFNISSAKITVNGTTYNVSIPNSQLTVAVTGKTKISPNTAVMIDVSPTVAAVFRNNATVFIMAPAARAVVVSNVVTSGNGQVTSSENVGDSEAISSDDRAELQQTRPNITITSAALAVNGNVTTLSVSVKDSSNASVQLNNLVLFGTPAAQATVSSSANAVIRAQIGSILSGGRGAANASASANAVGHVGLNIIALRVINFIISGNGGGLTLPSASSDFEGNGLTLTSGSSATLSYNGVISYNNNAIVVTPTIGSQYRITVTGDDDEIASTNVTVT